MNQNANEIIEYGLDSISVDEKIEIDLKDFVYIYKTFEEFNRYFHQPLHYTEISDIKKYMGNKEQGAYSIIAKLYYKVMDKYVKGDLKKRLEDEDGKLINPNHPYYFNEK